MKTFKFKQKLSNKKVKLVERLTLIKSTMPDVSALGAAYLAGLGAGIFKNLSAAQQLFGQRPALTSGKYLGARKHYETWNKLIN